MSFDEKDEFYRIILEIRNKYRKYIDFRPEVGMPKNITNENLDKF